MYLCYELHITVTATDEEKQLERNMKIARDIKNLGGKVVLRVVTFAERAGDNRWRETRGID